jgi:uncharacterized phage protein (TIGR02220 family)
MDLIKESNGLFIPAHILYDKNLSSNEKIILSQIYWYDQNTDCHASNKHFSNILGFSVRGTQKVLSSLKEKGYLDTNGSRKRVIKINHEQMFTPRTNVHEQMFTPMNKCSWLPRTNVHSDHEQMFTPIKKNRIKKIKKNNIYSEDAQKVLDYLNTKKGSKYTKKDAIIARLKKGASVEDCIKIIDVKLKDQYFIDHPKYLCPSTLFCEKHFDDYLNETPEEDNWAKWERMHKND